MDSLHEFLDKKAQKGYVAWEAYHDATANFDCTLRTVEKAIFEMGLMPLRYKRNQHALKQHEQYTLFQSHVLIVGCGGLGGVVATLLARIGIGKITLVDMDYYEEHNLNRQCFSTIKNLGKSKVQVVREGILEINPALEIEALHTHFSSSNANLLIREKDVVVDALDSPSSKALLASTCKTNNIPFVHGAISGWAGQCTTNSRSLTKFYENREKGSEAHSGNLSMTTSFCGSIEAALTIKHILNKEVLENSLIFFDLLDNEMHKVNLP